MRFALAWLFLFAFSHADFFITSGEQKVKMATIQNGTLRFAEFATLPKIIRGNDEIHVISEGEKLNPKHFNFRLVKIEIPQENHFMTPYWHVKSQKEWLYEVEFGDYTTKEGVMLQLFYLNRWYGVILGEPLEILHDLFSNQNLEPKAAYEKIKKAREAFKDDAKLAELERFWQEKASAVVDKNAQYKKQERIDFSKLKH
ncbi:MAG: hypothetical protein IE916_04920 [Epsilonproteobacteria bacterium]|nr:hypothetical protein [Campylobacterota bacterium]